MLTSEVAPLVKVGGLGDVIEGLSKALVRQGHEVCIVCPRYEFMSLSDDWVARDELLNVPLGQGVGCQVWEGMIGDTGAKGYLLENDVYFGGTEVYDSNNKWVDRRRFVVLSRAGVELIEYLGWEPDVVHVHDWITSLATVYTEKPTMLTIHNMYFQGKFDPEMVPFLGLNDTEDWVKGRSTNLLRGGLLNADRITTVSSNYASEILSGNESCGLKAELEAHPEAFTGIQNGIDTQLWDPATDKYLSSNYDVSDISGKAGCKQFLQEKMGLEVDGDVALMGVVARMYDQKGLDLLIDVAPKLLEKWRMQLVVMGRGEKALERRYKDLAEHYKGRVGVHIGYEEDLAHWVWGGTDFYLMPSRFEPCGLSQLYGLRYGSVPIVRHTGGLKDTVIPWVDGESGGTGIAFDEANTEGLYGAMRSGLNLYYNKPEAFREVQANGMSVDNSWDRSVGSYIDLYEELVGLVGASA